ncbi:SDR family oxidoreductase [Marivirga atlantica]|uniref:SDR family NAD(P)-dependent oxidoreductase n=1 Tax=Marivirga atlantica TaxID=1548457 RepID=A0A937AJ22_9BACT|nr:NAD(P)-binding domain-containing protein [Marivirga atlantica]MBL0764503.1 SDR family NAD(P)-dependent oxidoreductase [Marivirga atlantica]
MKNISILGCGWLGLPLASHFCNKGFEVKGSTTSADKFSQIQEVGAQAYLVDLPHSFEVGFLKDADIIIINIPPQTRKKGKDFHKACIEQIIPHIASNTKIIYVSATSVYPDLNQPIDESIPVDKDSERAQALWQAENLLKENCPDQTCILRFGGLLGYDRIPGKYFAGKEVDTPDERVNYIHRDDAIGIISRLVEDKFDVDIYNGVAPLHPTKKEVYLNNAEQFKFDDPIFEPKANQLKNRYIDSQKVVSKLGYSFIYPDPLRFHYTK